MKNPILHFLLILLVTTLNGQSSNSSIYGELPIMDYYAVTFSSTTVGEKSSYYIEDEEVTKEAYDKVKDKFRNIENCLPCVLRAYTLDDVLLKEAVSYSDCYVGWYKEFDDQGHLTMERNYKQNHTGNWDSIWKRGYCSVRDGKCTYFNQDGKADYSEIWSNGEFLKQSPEQEDSEIWKVDFLLNNRPFDAEYISVERIRELQIVPKYKNSNRLAQVTLELEISKIGYRSVRKEISTVNFKDFDYTAILEEVGMENEDYCHLSIVAKHDKTWITKFNVKLVK